MIKSYKEVTLNTREIFFPLQKSSKTKNCEECFSKIVFEKTSSKFFLYFKSHSAGKNEKWVAIAKKIKCFLKKWAKMNQSCFLRSSLRFHSALANLEPPIYRPVEQFGAENISLLSGLLVKNICSISLLKKRKKF